MVTKTKAFSGVSPLSLFNLLKDFGNKPSRPMEYTNRELAKTVVIIIVNTPIKAPIANVSANQPWWTRFKA